MTVSSLNHQQKMNHIHTGGKLHKEELVEHILSMHPEHVHPIGQALTQWSYDELIDHHNDMHLTRERQRSVGDV